MHKRIVGVSGGGRDGGLLVGTTREGGRERYSGVVVAPQRQHDDLDPAGKMGTRIMILFSRSNGKTKRMHENMM